MFKRGAWFWADSALVCANLMYRIINRKKLIVTAAVDAIGYLLFGTRRFFPKAAIRNEEIKSVLIIRTAFIGDVVMTLPLLKPLKELYPDARISFLTAPGAAEVLRQNPFLDEIITFSPFWFYGSNKAEYPAFIRGMRGRSFDLIIEARGDIREILLLAWRIEGKYRVSYDVGGGGYLLTHVVPDHGRNHRVEYHLDIARYLGYRGNDVTWGVSLTEDERNRVDRIMENRGIKKPFIAVHPGSRLELKRWRADRYGALCDRITATSGMQVVVFGAERENPIVGEMTGSMKHKPVSFAGEVNMREFAGLVSHAALFVCNDSAPMHVAAAMKTPTLAIFGPSKSGETGPYGAGHRVVERNFSCRFTCDENSCRHERYNACITDITVDEVFQTAIEMIRSGQHNVQT